MVAGHVPENPSELIDSDRMRELIREAEANYDLVVIDTPPATMVADAIPLMSEATAVVIVGRVGRITSAEANSLREQLERIDAPSFGLVANFAGGDRQVRLRLLLSGRSALLREMQPRRVGQGKLDDYPATAARTRSLTGTASPVSGSVALAFGPGLP